MEKRAAATFPTETDTEAAEKTSIEALSEEVGAQLRSAQHRAGLFTGSYYHRVQGTLRDSSGGILDSHITIEIKPQDSSAESEGSAYPVRNEGTFNGGPDYEAAKVPYGRSE